MRRGAAGYSEAWREWSPWSARRASRHKFGNKAVRAFSGARATRWFPSIPTPTEIEGKRAYRSVRGRARADRHGHRVSAARTSPSPCSPDFKRKGIGEVWLNPGADDDEVIDEARRLGLNAIVACSIMGAGQRPSDY